MFRTILHPGAPPIRLRAPFSAEQLRTLLRTTGPPLLFGFRLWASVCLALYVAFRLEFDDAYWAGTSAALMCQPHLGASLRKGWFRVIGTFIGAVAIVVLTACFPQARVSFLVGLALWGGACALVATLLRNFAAYAAALSGYTAAIIASDQLGAVGGLNGQAFTLAVTRVSEICIGIVCAGVILAGTDLGGARRRLATVFAGLGAGIAAGLTRTLALAGPEPPETERMRRDFIRRIIALDPVVDETLGESSQLRYHSPVLQQAVDGFFTAMSGWRAVASRFARLPHDQAQADAAAILQRLAPELISAPEPTGSARWMANPTSLQQSLEAGIRRLLAYPAETPSQRLLADKAAETLDGLSCALSGQALLLADPARPVRRYRGLFRLRVPDWLPPLVNGGRAFVTISAVALFWIVTAWPGGATAITFAAITVILLAPRSDQAYASALLFSVGTLLAAVFAAILMFAVLPRLQTFAEFSIAIGAYLIPVGALMAQPWKTALFIPMTANFVPLLGPANQMSYDTVAFYNSALALVAGCAMAVMAFRLLPPLSPAFRTRRLLALTLRDLRRLASGRSPHDWQGHVHGRLSAMPEVATPLQRARLVAALSVGTEIIRLRYIMRRLGQSADLDAALAAVANGNSARAAAHLDQLDAALADRGDVGEVAQTNLRARSSILAVAEALMRHAAYFDGGADQ
jgi:uncharacterized membrane protein YccC